MSMTYAFGFVSLCTACTQGSVRAEGADPGPVNLLVLDFHVRYSTVLTTVSV